MEQHEEKAYSLNSQPLCFDGPLTDKLPGWKFVPSDPKDGMTYNPFEGYYPDKGGKLISPRITLDAEDHKPGYYRITFEAEAPQRAYQGINFYDAEGNLLPDLYDVVYPGEKQSYDRIFYAMRKVSSLEVFFQTTCGIRAWNLKLTWATPEEAVAYCDRLYAALPPVRFTAPEDAMKLLPRTCEALKSGKPWRVVLLGDSIMQDTFHSQFHSLLQREFPNANFEWVISMRGGTGCWYYSQVDQFKKYVYDEKPDLLIIGGISNYRNTEITGHEAMGIVARAAKAFLGCEVLLLTGALAVDTRMFDPQHPEADLPVQPWTYKQDKLLANNLAGLQEVGKSIGCPVWDMHLPCYEWLYASGKPYEFYSRDTVHSGEKGKQIIGRILLEYLKTAGNAKA